MGLQTEVLPGVPVPRVTRCLGLGYNRDLGFSDLH